MGGVGQLQYGVHVPPLLLAGPFLGIQWTYRLVDSNKCLIQCAVMPNCAVKNCKICSQNGGIVQLTVRAL